MVLDYTLDRHVALCLVALDQVIVDDSIMCLRNREEMPVGVFAALLVTGSRGYIGAPAPSEPDSTEWPVRLTVAGTQLLSRFHREHGRPRVPVRLLRSTPAPTRGTAAVAPTAGSVR